VTAPGAPYSPASERAVADVAIVGAGVVGLCTALACADRGLEVLLLVDVRPGEASAAAAGLLAPSVNAPTDPAAATLARAARDGYPAYLEMLAERGGVQVPLNRLGALELALSDEAAEALRLVLPEGSSWLDAAVLAGHEPALAHAAGAAHHPRDGAVNNLVMLRALKAILGRHERVRVLADAAESIEPRGGDDVAVATRGGTRLVARRLVVASGAWAPQLGGLPRALPIVPLRGHMLSVAGSPIRHVTFGAGGYLVPRGDGRTYVGSTDDSVGFDASTTEAGIAEVRRIGAAIAAPIATARMLNGWAGLRPMSPDGQPLVGPDPEAPSVLYACGHSRNGVLLAPITGMAVGALAAGDAPAHDMRAWSPARFG
jgi:glycine oxidase